MWDDKLRRTKDAVLEPAVRSLSGVSPLALTAAGLGFGLASAVCAAWGQPLAALGLWLVNRTFDGLDGLVARRFGKTSDRGGYLDLVADFVVYAAIPIGLAWGHPDAGVWVPCAFLLASFYVNAVSWLALSALGEKRRAEPGRLTSLAMPRGLMEGFETIVLYTAFFLWTDGVGWLFGLGALLVGASALQRVWWVFRGGLS